MKISQAKIANSLVWSGVENGSLALVSFTSLIVYSRLLSASEFGLFSVVLALVELLAILVTMLFHDALVQRSDVTELHFDTAFSVGMAISVVLMLGCWLAAPLFERLVQVGDAGRVLAWVGLMFPCLGAGATIVARQRREFGFKSLAIRSLSGRVVGGVAGIAAAFLHAGVWSLVLQQIVTAAVGSAVLWLTCIHRPRLRFGRLELRQLIGFGAFSVTNLFLQFSVKRVFTIVAGVRLGVATAGYLNLGFRVVDVLWSIAATGVSQVSLPMLSGLQSDPDRLRRAYRRSVEFACLLLYPCFVGIALTASEIVEVMFGRQWALAAACVAALALLVVAQAPRLFAGSVMSAIGRPSDSLPGVIVELGVMLAAFAVFGLPSLGWAIGIWLVSECSQIVVSTWMLRRAAGYGLLDQFSGVRVPLLAVLVMAVALGITRQLLPDSLGAVPRLGWLITTGALVYLGALMLLNRLILVAAFQFVRRGLVRRTS